MGLSSAAPPLPFHFDSIVRWLFNFHEKTSTSQSMLVAWLRNWRDSWTIFFFAFYSLSAAVVAVGIISFRSKNIESRRNGLFSHLRFVQNAAVIFSPLENCVTVCLQPHVKHEWNNRYSHFFSASPTTMSTAASSSFECILFAFPLIFGALSSLLLVLLPVYSAIYISVVTEHSLSFNVLLLVSIIIWSEMHDKKRARVLFSSVAQQHLCKRPIYWKCSKQLSTRREIVSEMEMC